MNYQVLARKWRPRNFHEMVGQTHVLRALINALDTGRLHHAYLFTGTRGVGKTTISRILTKCLNCEQGISSTPCGICPTCKEIDEGRFIDLIEVDGASRTKVEDTRELLENVQYAPSKGRFKVYLIDEVHMLSTHSFNALLKTLEEPPPHVKFLLATTDPQKLPVTILSRCLQFALKNIPAERIVAHLEHVLSTENIPFETDALWLLGRAAQGSMRDAMSLTDQAIAFGDEKVYTADVRDMLGALDQNQLYDMLFALLELDAAKVLAAINQLSEQSPDWLDVLNELLSILHRISIAQLVPDAIDNSLGDKEQISALASALPAEDIQFYYQVGLIGKRDLPLAPSPQQGFEMVLLRMLAFRPNTLKYDSTKPLKRIAPSKTEQAPAEVEKKNNAQPQADDIITLETPHTEAIVCVASSENITPEPSNTPEHTAIPAPLDEVISTQDPVSADTTMAIAQSQDEEEPSSMEDDYLISYDLEHLPEELYMDSPSSPSLESSFPSPATGLAATWLDIFPKLGLTGITASIASNCTLNNMDDDCWQLQLAPNQQALFSENQKKRISDAIELYLGHPIKLIIEVSNPSQETPAQREAFNRHQLQKNAEQAIHDDPIIQTLQQRFGATLLPDSIKPIINTNTLDHDK